MRWSLDGWQPGWAGLEHPTTWTRGTGPRSGWPSARTRARAPPGHISITCVRADGAARAAGEYFYQLRKRAPNPEVRDEALQGELVEACRRISGVTLPG